MKIFRILSVVLGLSLSSYAAAQASGVSAPTEKKVAPAPAARPAASSQNAGAPAPKYVVTKQALVVVTMENKLIDGKKTWVPSRSELPPATDVRIDLKNPLAEPHGFEIPGLVKPVTVMTNVPLSVTFKTPTSGKVEYKCQLHPAHVGGSFTIK